MLHPNYYNNVKDKEEVYPQGRWQCVKILLLHCLYATKNLTSDLPLSIQKKCFDVLVFTNYLYLCLIIINKSKDMATYQITVNEKMALGRGSCCPFAISSAGSDIRNAQKERSEKK